jgi:nuclear GTP-binding protein
MAPVKRSGSLQKTRSSSSKSPKVTAVKGENFYRNAKQVAQLKMLDAQWRQGHLRQDGNIIQAAAFQKSEKDTKPGRIQPDRRWFGTFLVDLFFRSSLPLV